MKKLLIAVGFLVILAGAWYGQKFLTSQNDLRPNPEAPVVLGITGTTAVAINDGKVTQNPAASNDAALRAQALAVAHQPIMIKNQLAEATIVLAKKKIGEAISSIELNYDYDTPWLDLGAYRKLIGDYTGAIAAWEFLGTIRPNAYVSYHNLGDLYAFTLNDPQKGERYFLKSIQIGPGNIQGYLALASLYHDSAALGKADQVEKLLLAGVAANEGNFSLLVNLAGYYRDNNRKDLALKYFEKALAVDPQNQAVTGEIAKLKQ